MREEGAEMRRGNCLASVTVTTPDISVPSGIGSKHYTCSIIAYLHPVYWLLDPILYVGECVFLYPEHQDDLSPTTPVS